MLFWLPTPTPIDTKSIGWMEASGLTLFIALTKPDTKRIICFKWPRYMLYAYPHRTSVDSNVNDASCKMSTRCPGYSLWN